MDNNDYIKSLEERIKKLEEFVSHIDIKKSGDISISNCNIQGIGISKGKNVSVKDCEMQGFGGNAFSFRLENCKVENCQIKCRKQTNQK